MLPPTSTGAELLGAEPLPSWPPALSPQHEGVPAAVRPQAWSRCALRAAKVVPPATATGVGLRVVEPLPSWPLVFGPQQYAAPLETRPHVKSRPALTAANTRPTSIAADPLCPSLVAVIVVDPAATPVTSPVADTAATAGAPPPQGTARPLRGLPARG